VLVKRDASPWELLDRLGTLVDKSLPIADTEPTSLRPAGAGGADAEGDISRFCDLARGWMDEGTPSELACRLLLSVQSQARSRSLPAVHLMVDTREAVAGCRAVGDRPGPFRALCMLGRSPQTLIGQDEAGAALAETQALEAPHWSLCGAKLSLVPAPGSLDGAVPTSAPRCGRTEIQGDDGPPCSDEPAPSGSSGPFFFGGNISSKRASGTVSGSSVISTPLRRSKDDDVQPP
jgi:hypothetical protein